MLHSLLPTQLGFQDTDMDAKVFISTQGHFASLPTSVLTLTKAVKAGNWPFDFVDIINVTENFRSINPKSRSCLFADELELDHFPVYSFENCLLECTWTFVADKVGCVPWYLKEYFPTIPMCEDLGRFWFAYFVDRRHTLSAGCVDQCPADCVTITYKYHHQVIELSGEQNCQANPNAWSCKYQNQRKALFQAQVKDIFGSR